MTTSPRPPLPLALIVDDDATFRMLSRMSLEQDELLVEEAVSGEAAIEFVSSTMPDIIILDLQMPAMHGFAVCEHIRRLPHGTFVPILIMTGLDDVDSIAQAYEMGATDFIVKPCHEGLVNIIQQVWGPAPCTKTVTAVDAGADLLGAQVCMTLQAEAVRLVDIVVGKEHIFFRPTNRIRFSTPDAGMLLMAMTAMPPRVERRHGLPANAIDGICMGRIEIGSAVHPAGEKGHQDKYHGYQDDGDAE